MNKKDNSRSRETDRRIIEAVYALLDKKKSIAKVTVREVCELAEINRSTFYAHYVDVYDLFEKVEKEMERRMTEAFIEQIHSGSDMGKCFINMFEFICEYRQFYEIYLSEANHPTIGLARDLYQAKLGDVDMSAFGFDLFEGEIKYQEDFFIAGLTAIIRRWVSEGCVLPPEELVVMLGHQYSQKRELFDWSEGEW